MTDFHQTPSEVRSANLTALRVLMHQQGIDALIIPSADPHMSEYLPVYWQGRAWLSGFTGSVGTLVITADFAGMWTDSRYWVQAPLQLDGTGIELKKMEQGRPTFAAWLAEHLSKGSKVAIDGAVLSVAEHDSLLSAFADKDIQLVTDVDLLDAVWTDRPVVPTQKAFAHDACFVSVTAKDKLAAVRTKMRELGARYHLISSLDDIAWLTNLRGQDVDYNPVFLSHLLISQDKATLYVNPAKLDNDLVALLVQAGIDIQDYEAIKGDVATVSDSLLIDPAKVAHGTLSQLDKAVMLIKAMNPSSVLKAVKTADEVAHVQEAMRADGAALCDFFAEVEARLARGETVTEVDIDHILYACRSRRPHFVSPSFDTIAGFGANGAIVHYKATEDVHQVIAGDGLLLIDSGAQYQNGTTDITRMLGVGTISDAQRYDVTCVLKAHIALAQAHFPSGIASAKIDILARNQMWQHGLDYGHGTGHGVGYFLNVHEGPQVISHTALPHPERILVEGMITSNEPGLYREGKWGVRLENLVVCVPASKTEFGEFLKFKDLTLCPFDTRLINTQMLTQTEKDWLNAYHQRVRDELIDLVEGDGKAWLIARTQSV